MRTLGVPTKVDFAFVKYSKAELLDAATQLLETAGTWSGGLAGLSYAAADTASGSVVLGVDMKHLTSWRAALPRATAAVPVTLRGESATGVEFQSRWSDFSPWSGGLALYGVKASGPGATYSECTGGWTWTRWSGLGNAASVAEHCVNARDGSGNYLGTTYSPFKNNGTNNLVGVPVRTSPAADAALLQSVGQSYSATVWVGAANTSDLRVVQSAAASDSVGESVALSPDPPMRTTG